ncbi:MAG: 1-acyl-sn-glycerol-3-phosphate acyltransferase [Candidatus Azotimanducaceae bacterium]|jgi:1-acyl-sn-glycerol-3-phosphate acyltransferase
MINVEDFPAPKCNAFAHWLGKTIIRISGWRVAGGVPTDSKSMLIIAAPHTTNWDLFFLLGAAYSFRLSIHWLVKDSLFLPLIGSILSFLGGVPVDRSKNNNLVEDLAARIQASDGLALVVPPSGTRRYTDYWKSGFYRIALAANVPIVCGYLDYARKEAGLGMSFYLSGNMTEDMDKIRAFYEPITGKHPDNKSRIRLREEDAQRG